MPKRSDRPVRPARVKQAEDGTLSYDRRDYGPCSIRSDGTAVNGFTTGGYGPRITNTIASRLPSLIKATGGRYSTAPTRRRFKGAKAGSVNPLLRCSVFHEDLFARRAMMQVKILHGKAGPGEVQAYYTLDAKLRAEVPHYFTHNHSEMQRERHRIGCEIGRAKANGRVVNASILTPIKHVPYVTQTRRARPVAIPVEPQPAKMIGPR